MWLHLYLNEEDRKEDLAIVFGDRIPSWSLDEPQHGKGGMDRMGLHSLSPQDKVARWNGAKGWSSQEPKYGVSEMVEVRQDLLVLAHKHLFRT